MRDIFYKIADSLRKSKLNYDDDWVDRLYYLWTSTFLLLFALVVAATEYAGDPIICPIPPHSRQALQGWERYINSICWTSNTYWVRDDENISESEIERRKAEIQYYQWVCFVLFLQAVIFYLPRYVWRGLSDRSGVIVGDIVEASHAARGFSCDNLREAVGKIARYMDHSISFSERNKLIQVLSYGKFRQRATRMPLCCSGARFGFYLTSLYLLTKTAYLAIGGFQFWLISSLLGLNHTMAAFTFWQYDGFFDRLQHQWMETGRFPRVTMCDFKMRTLGNHPKHTVQCVLPVNILNEKIYIFQLLWLIILSILCLFSLLRWIWALVPHCNRYRYVKHLVTSAQNNDVPDVKTGKLFRKFVSQYLRTDGVFLLKVVGTYSGSLVEAELATALWRAYQRGNADTPSYERATASTITSSSETPRLYTENPTAAVTEHSGCINGNSLAQLTHRQLPVPPITTAVPTTTRAADGHIFSYA